MEKTARPSGLARIYLGKSKHRFQWNTLFMPRHPSTTSRSTLLCPSSVDGMQTEASAIEVRWYSPNTQQAFRRREASRITNFPSPFDPRFLYSPGILLLSSEKAITGGGGEGKIFEWILRPGQRRYFTPLKRGNSGKGNHPRTGASLEGRGISIGPTFSPLKFVLRVGSIFVKRETVEIVKLKMI